MLRHFLSPADTDRAQRTLHKLGCHDIRHWALTGGLAAEVHRLLRGFPMLVRPLNDLDFLVDSFEAIPQSLANDFLFRHLHPADPPNKLIVQFVDAETRLRVDIFRSAGATMNRTTSLHLPTGTIKLISPEDLVARIARLALDLAREVPTPAKHVTDFLRLAELTGPANVEAAWLDHRKPGHPTTFIEAASLLQQLIPARRDLLITPDYSKDVNHVCTRCSNTGALRLADPNMVLSLLGYC